MLQNTLALHKTDYKLCDTRCYLSLRQSQRPCDYRSNLSKVWKDDSIYTNKISTTVHA